MFDRTTVLTTTAAAVLLSALAFLLLRPPSTEVEVDVARNTVDDPAAHVAPQPEMPAREVEENLTDRGFRAPQKGEAWDGPPGVVRASARNQQSVSEFPELDRGPAYEPSRTRSAQAQAELIKESVTDILLSLDPALSSDEITSWCTSDGLTCKLEGPWVGDDFATRWLGAIVDGRLDPKEYEGVVFDRFVPVEVDGEQRFEIVASAQ